MKTTVFGKVGNSATATLFHIENKNGMCVSVSDFGATLQSLTVNGKNGKTYDVALGHDSPEEYTNDGGTYFGATVGRNGNRISKGIFTLNGVVYRLDKNNNGNNLHSGFHGYQERMWNVHINSECSITFSLLSPSGDQGFPGNASVSVTYTLTDDNALEILYRCISDEDTVINMTNHSYFNLNGHDSGDVLMHTLFIDSDSFTAIDKELIPTGEIRPVGGTPLDFRLTKTIGQDIASDYTDMVYANGYDHNFCLNNNGTFAKVADITGDVSGIKMDVFTDMPGMQIYTANYVNGVKGKDGALYQPHSGVCFETQGYPDAVNHKSFPTVIRLAGEEFTSKTVYKFSV